jgi:hypothetical protein
MTLSFDAVREARNRLQYLDHLFGTPDSWDCGATSIDSGIGAPYKWMHTKSRFVPCSVAMYDMLFSEMIPEHEDEWRASQLRSVVKEAKGERFDVALTIDIIVGWIRRPDVWNDVSNNGKFVEVNALSTDDESPFYTEQRWSLMCKAVATNNSVMPRAAIESLDDSIFSKEGWMTTNYNRFVEAAIDLDYDASVARILTRPLINIETTDDFIGTLDTKYGDALPWLAALETLMSEKVKFTGSEYTLQKKVARSYKNNLLPKDIIKWGKLGVPFDQMLVYAKNGIDEDILSMMLSRNPGLPE